MKTTQAYLRRCAESAIGFANKLRADLFFRTETVLVVTLLLLCALYIATIATSTYFLHLEIAAVIVENLTETVASGNFDSFAASEATINELRAVRMTHLTTAGSVIVIATLIFGYIAARVALTPTRNALDAQKQFIANIAHELRTPLSVLRANSELALLEHPNTPHIAEMAQNNIEELDRMAGIIDNLLTLNILFQAERITFEFVDLNEVVDRSVAAFAPLAERAGVRLVAEKRDGVRVWGNRQALEQIAMNIMKNSLAHTKEGGTVRASVRKPRRGYVTLEMSDTGIGIEHSRLKRVFEPFYRIEPSRTREKGSSGLGLAIVSELVKLHRGKIAISSIPRTGTTIRVTLPLHERKMRTRRSTQTITTSEEVHVDFRA